MRQPDLSDVYTTGRVFTDGGWWHTYSDGTRLRVIAGAEDGDGGSGGDGSGGQQGQQGNQGNQGGAGDGSGAGAQGGQAANNGGSGGGSGGDGGQGGQGGAGDGQQGGGQQGGAGDGNTDKPTHTQEQVDAVAQMERRRGFRKFVKDEYGMSVDRAREILAAAASGGDGSGGGGGQRPNNTNNNGGGGSGGNQGGGTGSGEGSRPDPAAHARDQRNRWEGLAERALLRGGFPADASDTELRRAVRLLDVDDDADDLAEFTTEVAKLKSEMPDLFKVKASGGQQGGSGSGNGGQGSTGGTPSSTPGGTAPQGQPPAGAKERGKSRADRFNTRRGAVPAK